MVLSSRKLAARSLREVVEWAAKSPGTLNVAQVGPGVWEFFYHAINVEHGLKMARIPYKTTGDVRVAAAAGDVHLYVDTVSSGLADIQAGLVNPVAILGARRIPELPDLPTVTETGVTRQPFDTVSWIGLLAPNNLPREITLKLNEAVREAIRDPHYASQLKSSGSVARASSPDELQAIVAKDYAKFSQLAREMGITPQ